MYVRMTEGEVRMMMSECAYGKLTGESCYDCYWGAVCGVVAPSETKPSGFTDADTKRCVNGVEDEKCASK